MENKENTQSVSPFMEKEEGVFSLSELIGDSFNHKEEEDTSIKKEGEEVSLSDVAKGVFIQEEEQNDNDTPKATEAVVKEIIEEEKPAEEEPVKPVNNVYKDFINRMVESGRWTGVEALEYEDGTSVNFDEAEISEEVFDSIYAAKMNEIEERLTKDKVSLEGNSEFTKKLIELEKAGGNVGSALQFFQEFQDPLSKIDVSTEEGQISAISMVLRQKGMAEDDIEASVLGFRAKGSLEKKGTEAYEVLNKVKDEYMDRQLQAVNEAKERRKTAIKEYRSSMSKLLGKGDGSLGFHLNDNTKAKLIDFATKEGSDGSFGIDSKLLEIRKDPKETAELTFFLLDRKGYLEQKFSRYKKDVHTGVVKLVSRQNENRSNGGIGIRRQDESRQKEEHGSLQDLIGK